MLVDLVTYICNIDVAAGLPVLRVVAVLICVFFLSTAPVLSHGVRLLSHSLFLVALFLFGLVGDFVPSVVLCPLLCAANNIMMHTYTYIRAMKLSLVFKRQKEV